MFFGTLPDDPDGIIDRAELSTSRNAAALTIVWYGDGEFEVVIEGNSNARVLRVELSGPMKGTEQFACSAAGAHVFVNPNSHHVPVLSMFFFQFKRDGCHAFP